MTTLQVATLLQLDPRTVSRYVKQGKITVAFRTPGGQARFRRAEIEGMTRGTK